MAKPSLLQGVLLVIATALTISLQDVAFKIFSGELTLWQIFALRGVLALPVLLVIIARRGPLRATLVSALGRWSLIRGTCLTLSLLAFYAALPFISLSTAGAAMYLAPIFVAVLSSFVIKEPVGSLGWFGVVLGFLGVFVLLRPGTDLFSPFALLPLLGAVFYALTHIITRTRCQGISSAALAFSLNLQMCLAGFVISTVLVLSPIEAEQARAFPYLLGTWSTLTLTSWLSLALLAGVAIIVAMMLARSYQITPPATAATFEYSYLIFAALWDILFFGIPPTWSSLAGMILIVIAGLFVMQRPAENTP